MHRSRKMLLLFVAFALEVNAPAVHARSGDACRPIPVGVDALGEPSLVLRVGVLNACVVRTRTAPRLPTGDRQGLGEQVGAEVAGR